MPVLGTSGDLSVLRGKLALSGRTQCGVEHVTLSMERNQLAKDQFVIKSKYRERVFFILSFLITHFTVPALRRGGWLPS